MPLDKHVGDQRAQDVAREGSLWQLDQERRAAAKPLWRLCQPQDHLPAEPTGAHFGVCVCVCVWASVRSLSAARVCLCVYALTDCCMFLFLQYVFDITKEEDEVLVSLQQRDMKIQRRVGQGENLSIGYAILKVRTDLACCS